MQKKQQQQTAGEGKRNPLSTHAITYFEKNRKMFIKFTSSDSLYGHDSIYAVCAIDQP